MVDNGLYNLAKLVRCENIEDKCFFFRLLGQVDCWTMPLHRKGDIVSLGFLEMILVFVRLKLRGVIGD